MKLLVTGGAGYVGSVVTALLLEVGHEVTGHPVPAVDGPRRAGDPAVLVAANDRAREELGGQPSRGLDTIVADAWAFVRGRSGKQVAP